ncbi:hypothetical protein WDW86_22235 [Bdellovibrionota bacterium FG-2]
MNQINFLKRTLSIFLLTSLFIGGNVKAQTQPEAMTCVENFLKEYATIQSYSSIIKQHEYKDGELRNEHTLQVEHTKPEYIHVKYLDKGSTGIKNNDMEATYSGGETMGVKFGYSSGLGFFVNGPAKLVIGNSMSVTNPQVLADEYFTMNRMPLTYLAHIIQTSLPSL